MNITICEAIFILLKELILPDFSGFCDTNLFYLTLLKIVHIVICTEFAVPSLRLDVIFLEFKYIATVEGIVQYHGSLLHSF